MIPVVYFLVTFTYVEAVSEKTDSEISSMGKKFLFSLPSLLHQNPYMILVLYSGSQKTEFSFATIPEDLPTQTFTINANASYTLHHEIKENYDSAYGIRKGYILQAANPMEVVAYLNTSFTSAAFKPLPVSAWGKSYYAVTMNMNPSIQISSSENENRITIKFKIDQPREVAINYQGKKYAHDDIMIIAIGRDQSFSIEDCSVARRSNSGGLTGTHIISSKPIGVVTGNCYIITDTCKDKIGDLAIDAPLPLEHYGTEFVLYPLSLGSEPYTELWLMSNMNKTFVYFPDIFGRKFFLNNTATWHKLNISGSSYFNSTSPIQVVLVMYTKCPVAFGANGGPSISSLVPNDLFYHSYSWRSPHPHEIVVIFNDENGAFTYWKNSKIDKGMPSLNPAFSSKITRWRVGVFEHFSEYTDHMLQMTHSQKFGCYIVYLSNYASFVSHLGFYIPKSGKSEKFKEDNMGDWSDWKCPEKCSNTQQSRSRECKKSNNTKRTDRCDDEKSEVQWRQYPCFAKVCPLECKKTFWGEDCASTCDKCFDECNKFTGSCHKCVHGYKGPKSSCKQACGQFEYGINCEGDCREICSIDCADRASGMCIQEHYYDTGIIFGVVTLVLFFGGVFFCLYATGERTGVKGKRSAKSVVSKSYTMRSTSDDYSYSDVES